MSVKQIHKKLMLMLSACWSIRQATPKSAEDTDLLIIALHCSIKDFFFFLLCELSQRHFLKLILNDITEVRASVALI